MAATYQAAVAQAQAAANKAAEAKEAAEAQAEDDGVGAGDDVDTYADYEPSKIKIGRRHPDPVVETSSMSAVPPPDRKHCPNLALPRLLIEAGLLSGLQLESIVYASMRHTIDLPTKERGGFLVGDGPGIGKGRQIAGLIFENYRRRRKRSVWFSASADLAADAARDFKDIGAGGLPICNLPDQPYSWRKQLGFGDGIMFCTYSCLTSGNIRERRIDQLTKWCGGESFEGCLVFDECHKAKNATGKNPSQTAKHVQEIQRRMPKARVVYVSATGASELSHMAYMDRLGLWGEGSAFKDANEFIRSIEKRGVGAMEMVAMDMKGRGMFLSRTLSYRGAEFEVVEEELDPTYRKLYNDCATLWADMKKAFEVSKDMILDRYGKVMSRAERNAVGRVMGAFWGAHQRFFNQMCINKRSFLCRA